MSAPIRFGGEVAKQAAQAAAAAVATGTVVTTGAAGTTAAGIGTAVMASMVAHPVGWCVLGVVGVVGLAKWLSDD